MNFQTNQHNPIEISGEEVLRDGNKYTLDHQGGLTIHSVSRSSDAGVYTCTARDRQGHTAKRDATLDVVGKLIADSYVDVSIQGTDSRWVQRP